MLQIAGLVQLSVTSYVTSPYSMWMPVAVLASLAVITLLGLIYMLSGVLGRTEFRVWAKIKIYEVLLSLMLVFIFYAIANTFFTINPEPVYESLGLVPDTCKSVADFYSLAACDMQQFLQYTLNLNGFVYQAMVVFALVPNVRFDTSPALATVCGGGCGISGSFSISPVGVQQFVGNLLGALYPLFVLNQVQLLLLSASLLIFTLLMALGLIARIFVISRTFGGAMIAFAVGIGILYPLLVSLTYGVLDAGIQVTGGPLLSVAEWGVVIDSLLSILLAFLGLGFLGNPFGIMNSLIMYSGLIAAGLVVIPFLNFLIVDTFVIDFSRAVGERMDFMSLFQFI